MSGLRPTPGLLGVNQLLVERILQVERLLLVESLIRPPLPASFLSFKLVSGYGFSINNASTTISGNRVLSLLNILVV